MYPYKGYNVTGAAVGILAAITGASFALPYMLSRQRSKTKPRVPRPRRGR